MFQYQDKSKIVWVLLKKKKKHYPVDEKRYTESNLPLRKMFKLRFKFIYTWPHLYHFHIKVLDAWNLNYIINFKVQLYKV